MEMIGNPSTDRVITARQVVAVVRVEALHTVAGTPNATGRHVLRWVRHRGEDLIALGTITIVRCVHGIETNIGL